MTEPAVLPPSGTRTKLVVTIAFLAAMFLLGSQLIDPHQSRRVFAATAAVTSIISGLVPALGSRRPRLARWLLLSSLTAVAVMFGFLARMIAHGTHGG